MATGFFDGVAPATFHHYDPDEMVMGKRMEDHLRFAVAYWHSFAWEGQDPFGGQTFIRPWHPQDDMGRAKMKADVALFGRVRTGPFFLLLEAGQIDGQGLVPQFGVENHSKPHVVGQCTVDCAYRRRLLKQMRLYCRTRKKIPNQLQ